MPELLAVILTDVGLATTLLGLVSVLLPLRFLRIRTRARGALVSFTGVLLTAAAVTLPARESTVGRVESALDRALPTFQFNEVHSITVAAGPQEIYRAIKNVTAADISFFRTLVWLRRFGRPGPENILNSPAHRPLLDVATNTTFVTLADTPKEIVVGTVVVAPPSVSRSVRRPTSGEFVELRSRSGFALAAMNFEIKPVGNGTCVVSTETRVYATDLRARRRFAAYWRVIYPGSALIRRMWLRAIRQRAENA